MDITVRPSILSGAVTPPPSKSLSHRALIAACMAGDPGCVKGLGDSQDIDATRRCMEALLGDYSEYPVLDCGESASTLRFLIPLALVVRGKGAFTGSPRLMERPLQAYFDLFRRKKIEYTLENNTLTVKGRLTPGVYSLPGDSSSQFMSGLLMALPLLQGNSEILVSGRMQSRPYILMTMEVLNQFGILIRGNAHLRINVRGGQRYRPAGYTVEPDWSQAAFWIAARALGGQVEVRDMDILSTQGDRCVAALAEELGRAGDKIIDVSQIPDLLPPLAVIAAARREGKTSFVNAARLRLKESDRLASTAAMLGALGVETVEGPDFLTVLPARRLTGGVVDGAGDHRIVMAAAILATVCQGPVTIRGAEAVDKSYPQFFDHFRMLGGVADVL